MVAEERDEQRLSKEKAYQDIKEDIKKKSLETKPDESQAKVTSPQENVKTLDVELK